MKQYKFTGDGVRTFLDDVVGDVMESIHENGGYNGNVTITIGNRSITVPLLSETYEALDRALCESVEIWESEYLENE